MKGANMNTEQKRAHEADIMTKMIAIYCSGKNHTGRTQSRRDGSADAAALCPDCRRLRAYALSRITGCPRMDVKSFCSVCPVHCYSKDMRAQIRDVMRYSGPRMLMHHPIITLRHMWIDFTAHRREKKGLRT